MANLAIKGHATRGSEVIEILEMLGGKNIHGYVADSDCFGFYIGGKTNISYDWSHNFVGEDETIFTLEEFLEKFPYKVGDKVIYEDKRREITKMVWEEQTNTVAYKLDDKLYCNVINKLQPYKEETMEGKIESFEILESHCADEVKIEFDPSKFEIVKRENGYYVVKKQPQYPKTYEECCEVLGIDVSRTIGHSEDLLFFRDVTCYENNLLSSLAVLRKLLICRDAYWKIAGDWKPDVLNPTREIRYFLFCTGITIEKGQGLFPTNKILVFPTEEMRDAFYENFKELIEQCKELL